MTATVLHGDCIEQMRAMADASVDAIVTDPPYLISFMGSTWDSADGIAGKPEVWRQALRVLKPGGHMLAFSSSRTYHRMACAIEDAGFEIRDQIMWLYGSGFPKSLDVSKAIDKAAGAEREVIGPGQYANRGRRTDNAVYSEATPSDREVITAPATPEARAWAGFGTALKPAHEPIVVARKPLIGKVAQNVLTHGCGALNIDASRIPSEGGRHRDGEASQNRRYTERGASDFAALPGPRGGDPAGRWPANVLHDGSPEVLDAFAAFGTSKSSAGGSFQREMTSRGYEGGGLGQRRASDHEAVALEKPGYGDAGSPARFFYAAKASKADRAGSSHPTVKPLALMRYLCRLVCPPGGVILDPFAGSGTTLQAAMEEGFSAIGIEQSAEYVTDIKRRLELARKAMDRPAPVPKPKKIRAAKPRKAPDPTWPTLFDLMNCEAA